MLPRKKPEANTLDYRHRWPTQQTLVVPAEGVAPKRVKILQAMSLPLLWLNVKIDHWQNGIDEHMRSIETRKQESSSDSNMMSHRKGIFGKPRPGKSTHPYDTGIDPTATSESIPMVEPSITATPENPTANPGGRKLLDWHKSPSSRDTPNPDTRQAESTQNSQEHPHPLPGPTIRKGGSAFRTKWQRSAAKKSEPSSGQAAAQAQPQEGHQEEDHSAYIELPRKRRSAWKSVRDRRSTPHPHPPPPPHPHPHPYPHPYPHPSRDVHGPRIVIEQPNKPPSPKNKQKATVASAIATESGNPASESPIIRLLSSLVGRSASPRHTISPLDISSGGAQETTLPNLPYRRSQGTPGSGTSSSARRGRVWFPLMRYPQRGTSASPASVPEGNAARNENRCPACGYCKAAEIPSRSNSARVSSATAQTDSWFRKLRKGVRTQ